MRFSKKGISILIGLCIFPLGISAQDTAQTERRADSLYEEHQEAPALELYEQVLAESPHHFEALWRSSFLYSRLGNRQDGEDNQKEYYTKAIDLAKRALTVDSTHTQSNFVMSVAMGRQALISGSREKVSASRAIKKYADRAIKYDSTNAGAWHVLGRWHFKVANLSWLERTAANTLFGGIPDASNEKAAEYIQKAMALDEEYVLYYYDLARVFKELGRDVNAIETCQKAIELPVLVPGDMKIKEQCKQLIDDL
jgi:tetratricopeptide (TPR) repeat protein